MKGRPVDENYSLNQCCMLIRIDGDELFVPLNFNMTADEIREVYPYLLQMFNNRIANPALEFDDYVRRHNGGQKMTQAEYDARLKASQEVSRLWYGKSDASLLDIAIRLCVDLKLRSVPELRHLFDTTSSKPVREITEVRVDSLPLDAGKLTSEEAREVLIQNGLLTPTDETFDPGDEQDVPLGVAGDNAVNLYNSGGEAEFMSAELDAREQRLALEDRFKQVAQHGAGPLPEGDPDPAVSRPRLDVKGSGPISFYGDGPSVLDQLDQQEGFGQEGVKYEYDFEMEPDLPASGGSGKAEGAGSDPLSEDWDPGAAGVPAPERAEEPAATGGIVPFGSVEDMDDGSGYDGGEWDPDEEDKEARLRREEDEDPEYGDLDGLGLFGGFDGEAPVAAPPDESGDGDGF